MPFAVGNTGNISDQSLARHRGARHGALRTGSSHRATGRLGLHVPGAMSAAADSIDTAASGPSPRGSSLIPALPAGCDPTRRTLDPQPPPSLRLRMVTSAVAHSRSSSPVTAKTSAAATVMVWLALTTRPRATTFSPLAGARIFTV